MNEVKTADGDRLTPLPPGFAIPRLLGLMRHSIRATELDLSDIAVLTEAASGAYGVTPVIAAMAGARRVYARARASRYGSVAEGSAWVYDLVEAAGAAGRVLVVDELATDILGTVDIVTNSGHLRPISAELIDCLPTTAVVALMYEAWEFRPNDIDVGACARRNIPIVGVNERHAALDVFSFLGSLCAKQLLCCGLPIYGNRIALLCDNDFAEAIRNALVGLGARIEMFSAVGEIFRDGWDAIVVALKPVFEPRIGHPEARHLATVTPAGTIIIQFWGDVNRDAVMAQGLNIWPSASPPPGHMGALLSEIGPEPIVRLQTGDLRAAEWILRGAQQFPMVLRSPSTSDAQRTLNECIDNKT